MLFQSCKYNCTVKLPAPELLNPDPTPLNRKLYTLKPGPELDASHHLLGHRRGHPLHAYSRIFLGCGLSGSTVTVRVMKGLRFRAERFIQVVYLRCRI